MRSCCSGNGMRCSDPAIFFETPKMMVADIIKM